MLTKYNMFIHNFQDWNLWNTWAHEDGTNGEFIGAWLLLSTYELLSTKVRLRKISDLNLLHQSINIQQCTHFSHFPHGPTVQILQHVLYSIHCLPSDYPINITFSGVLGPKISLHFAFRGVKQYQLWPYIHTNTNICNTIIRLITSYIFKENLFGN